MLQSAVAARRYEGTFILILEAVNRITAAHDLQPVVFDWNVYEVERTTVIAERAILNAFKDKAHD